MYISSVFTYLNSTKIVEDQALIKCNLLLRQTFCKVCKLYYNYDTVFERRISQDINFSCYFLFRWDTVIQQITTKLCLLRYINI